MTSLTLAYLSLAFVFAITPGAATAVVIRHTLEGGRRRGITASLGAQTANSIQAILAVTGVSSLLVRWPMGLRWVAAAGAIFLAWIGIRSLRAAFRSPVLAAPDLAAPARTSPTSLATDASPYRDGLATNIMNPSMMSFYVGVAPTFVPRGASWHALALLCGAHIVIAFGCHVFWAVLFNQARGFFSNSRARRSLDAIVGVLLLYLAARVMSG